MAFDVPVFQRSWKECWRYCCSRSTLAKEQNAATAQYAVETEALCETLVRAIGHWEQFAHDAASINVGYRWLMFAIDVSRGNGGR
ncbi:hypothetical protein [Phyllobacterium brassicacearum]|uniref:hypothetical protein n=1 Tax=Phyllobacterium brassicacearum TaxID=314235 RepID=UPI000D10744B|nr:hypothetical protein [Phyllobacterium brassicacearum]